MYSLLNKNSIQLADNYAPTQIQVLRTGTFWKGDQKIEITKQMLLSMVKNHTNKVRGVDIALDFAHKSDLEAAAWFTELFVDEHDGSLWADVDWTKQGRAKVEDKDYRYVSADFAFDYENNETQKKHGPTLLGAGLTNRPVVKGMQPITLSEFNEHDKLEKEKQMSLEEENKKLKEELAALKEKMQGNFDKDKEKKFEEEKAELSEENDKLKKEIADTKVKEQVAAKKTEFDTMMSEGKACEAQRKSFMANDMNEFIKNAQEVNLDENGKGGELKKETRSGNVEDKVLELAEKKVKDNEGMEFGDAIDQVLSENPKMNDEYKKLYE